MEAAPRRGPEGGASSVNGYPRPGGSRAMSPESYEAFAFFVFPIAAHLCHAFIHGKQRQRQERTEEGAETQAQTGARPKARSVHARPAEIGEPQPRLAVGAAPDTRRPSAME